MRVLFTATPAPGHFLSTVPLAWALRAAGHEVLAANTGAAAATAVRAGLPVVDVAPGQDVLAEFLAASAAIAAAPAGAPRPRGGLGVFGELMADGLLDLARAFRPDLVVSTLEQGAGPLVAAALGVPLVEQSIRLAWAGSDEQASGYRRSIAAHLEPVRTRLRLPVPPPAALVLDVRPPSLGGTATESQALMRHVPYNDSTLLPDWVLARPERPRVCLTTGSQLALPGGGLDDAVAALVDDGLEVVVATSGPPPAPRGHVLSIGWLPLSAVLPSCAAIVHHGGAGTTLAALACGVPQLVLPWAADQPANAALVADRGVGLRRDLRNSGLPELGKALLQVVDGPEFGAAAAEVRAEIGRQPSPAEVVGRLERLAGPAGSECTP